MDLQLIFYITATILGVTGAYFNSRCDIRGLMIWIISNAFFITYGLLTHNYAIVFIMSLYLAISVYGIFQWNQKEVHHAN